MSRRDPFSQVAKDPAAPWWVKGVGADARAIGTWMCVRMCDPDGLLVGITLDQVADMVCRDMGFESRERAHCRRNVANLITRGLIVQTPEGVRVLWSPTSYRQHAPKLVVLASPKTAPAVTPQVAAPEAPMAVDENMFSVQSADSQPTVSRQSCDSQLELSVGSHSRLGAQKERKKEREKPPLPTVAPPTHARGQAPACAKGPRKSDEKRALWAHELAAAGTRHGFLAAKLLSLRQTGDVIAKAAAHATSTGVALEAVMRQMLDDAWKRHEETGKDLKWAICDWQPNAAPQRRPWGRQKLEALPASPRESFGTEEAAWALANARKAEIEAMLAKRAELRRVGP